MPAASSLDRTFLISVLWMSGLSKVPRETATRWIYPMVLLAKGVNSLQALLEPMCSLNLASFNVYTLNQIEQWAAQARTHESFKIDVYQTRRQNPTYMIAVRCPDTPLFSRITIRVSGNPVSSTLRIRVERVLLNRIPVNSRLQAVWAIGLHISIGVGWSAVASSLYLWLWQLITAPLKRKTSTTESYFDYCRVCVQQTLWSLQMNECPTWILSGNETPYRMPSSCPS